MYIVLYNYNYDIHNINNVYNIINMYNVINVQLLKDKMQINNNKHILYNNK